MSVGARELRIDAAGFLLAVLLPLVLWHATIAEIARGFRLELGYLVTGWAPWLLMAAGLACFVPVILDRLRDPHRRFYGSTRAAWLGWSVTLYLLGFLLATQVAQIAQGLSAL
jgi:hypothetical protein